MMRNFNPMTRLLHHIFPVLPHLLTPIKVIIVKPRQTTNKTTKETKRV